MAREKRVCFPGLIYHVINRGNNRQAIFLEDEDYELYLGLLYRFKRELNFRLFCFCLMTNHVHLLIRVGDKYTISQIMQKITNAHTRHYHFKYRTSGHVWQGRFKSPIISDDEYMLTAMQYIEQNPVRAAMVVDVGKYQWSSYKLNVQRKISKLIDREVNPVYLKLGVDIEERINEYRKRMKESLENAKLEEVRKSIKYGSGYMSERFSKQIKEMLPQKRKPGRPRRIKC